VRRIHIIGGPGSGKTTLARRLAARFGVPPTDLDEIGYEGGAGAKRPLAARLADVHALATRPEWITEGMYLWWIDDLLRSADAIIWLDVPWRVAAWRIVWRHIRTSRAGTNRHPGVRKLLRFLLSTRRYYVGAAAEQVVVHDDDGAVTRSLTALELAAYAGKVVRYSSSADVAALLSGVG
jgi:adenylate kinase family enzyme